MPNQNPRKKAAAKQNQLLKRPTNLHKKRPTITTSKIIKPDIWNPTNPLTSTDIWIPTNARDPRSKLITEAPESQRSQENPKTQRITETLKKKENKPNGSQTLNPNINKGVDEGDARKEMKERREIKKIPWSLPIAPSENVLLLLLLLLFSVAKWGFVWFDIFGV